MTRCAALILASFLLHAAPARAAAGDLDPTFGNGKGYVAVEPPIACTAPSCRLHLSAVAAAADGRIVFAGTQSGLGPTGRWIAGRVLADGSPDPSFGPGGFVAPAVGGHPDSVGVRVLPDGKLVFVGNYLSPNSHGGLLPTFLVRLHPDGSLDTSLDGAGYAIRGSDGEDQGGWVSGMGVQPDGGVLVARVAFTPATTLKVQRFLPDGTRDLSFGTGGTARITGAVTGQGTIAHLAVLPDGRFILAGTLPQGNDVTRLHAARFTAAGQQEAGYGSALAASPLLTSATSMALQSDGGVVLGGSRGISEPLALVRLGPTGALDPSFGVGGVATTSLVPQRLALQGDGRIVIGQGVGLRDTDFVLGRARPDGRPDAALRGTGEAAAGIGGGAALGDMTLDGAGRAVLTGSVLSSAGTHDPRGYLARFLLEGGYDIFTDARRFVMQQYRDFLAREGEAVGIDTWTHVLATGQRTRAEVALAFLKSGEFEGVIAPVARLYFAYFLRIPDQAGLEFWIGRARAGDPLESISSQFASSPEFDARYGALDNAQFVARVYQNVLGRMPDPDGAAFWTGQLDAQAITRGQLMVRFSESAEYRSLIASEIAVTMSYLGMLRRGPDPDGFSFWVQAMDGGASELGLIDAFVRSGEYRARFLP